MEKSCKSEYLFLKTQCQIAQELMKCKKDGMPPKRGISAAEVA